MWACGQARSAMIRKHSRSTTYRQENADSNNCYISIWVRHQTESRLAHLWKVSRKTFFFATKLIRNHSNANSFTTTRTIETFCIWLAVWVQPCIGNFRLSPFRLRSCLLYWTKCLLWYLKLEKTPRELTWGGPSQFLGLVCRNSQTAKTADARCSSYWLISDASYCRSLM